VPPEPIFAELGEMLRRLHELTEPPGLGLPPLDPFGRVSERLAVADIPEDDREFLCQRLASLRAEYDGLLFELPHGPVHGDAHTGNLLRQADGAVLLLDFERFASGPREWDLVESDRAFADAYGFDVATWGGFDILCSIRELTMTTWLMQHVNRGPDIARESARGSIHFGMERPSLGAVPSRTEVWAAPRTPASECGGDRLAVVSLAVTPVLAPAKRRVAPVLGSRGAGGGGESDEHVRLVLARDAAMVWAEAVGTGWWNVAPVSTNRRGQLHRVMAARAAGAH
jgi:hypothetical protein